MALPFEGDKAVVGATCGTTDGHSRDARVAQRDVENIWGSTRQGLTCGGGLSDDQERAAPSNHYRTHHSLRSGHADVGISMFRPIPNELGRNFYILVRPIGFPKTF